MRQKLVVGNWKMHGDRDLVNSLVESIIRTAPDLGDSVEIGVCPTYIHIEQAAKLLIAANAGIGDHPQVRGLQQIDDRDQGGIKFAGQHSAAQLGGHVKEQPHRRLIIQSADQGLGVEVGYHAQAGTGLTTGGLRLMVAVAHVIEL